MRLLALLLPLQKCYNKSRSTLSLTGDDSMTRFYTGFINYGTLIVFMQTLFAHGVDKLNYWKGQSSLSEKSYHRDNNSKKSGPPRKLSFQQEFLLVMMWLRLGLLELHLAKIFKISTSSVSRIINTWTEFLYEHTKSLVQWPKIDQVIRNLPGHFVHFPNVLIVFDCTEFYMEIPSSLSAQNLTWSEYKHSNTLKVLIGVTPDGHVGYIGEIWGGRASDRHIVIAEKVLERIPVGLAAMADKVKFYVKKKVLRD